ncbi:MAG: hypothetical protein ACR2JC_16155 [Chloroflexota bacterium]
MRKLKVNLVDIAEALENASDDFNYFLDLETGQIESTPHEVLTEANEVLDTVEGDAPKAFEEALDRYDGRGWEKEMIPSSHVHLGRTSCWTTPKRGSAGSSSRTPAFWIALVSGLRMRKSSRSESRLDSRCV